MTAGSASARSAAARGRLDLLAWASAPAALTAPLAAGAACAAEARDEVALAVFDRGGLP